VNNDRYANKEDFAVVVQPFSLNANFHYTRKGNKNVTDLSHLAADCLHLSQKGHALGKNLKLAIGFPSRYTVLPETRGVELTLLGALSHFGLINISSKSFFFP
jgi:hypothetical protein